MSTWVQCLTDDDNARARALAQGSLLVGGVKLGKAVTEADWCKAHRIKDSDYELPKVTAKGGSAFGGDVDDAKKSGIEKICGVQTGPALLFRNPVVATHDGHSDNLYIAEQAGTIYRLDLSNPRQSDPEVWLDLTKRVFVSSRAGDERGLLSLAFHPEFASNRRFFIFYFLHKGAVPGSGGTPQGYTRVAELRAGSNGKPIATSHRVILDILQPEPNHNGGSLAFGKKHELLVFTGDGGGAGDRHGQKGNGQNPLSLLGKALRVDVSDASKPYAIPRDNPFVGDSQFRPEIWAWGLRNPWRCTVDPPTRRVFCADVGQGSFEEVDLVEPGKNYGWRGAEGRHCYDKSLCQDNPSQWELPIFEYAHSKGKSITGGFVYRGCLYPKLQGKYIFGDFVTGRLWAIAEPELKGGGGGSSRMWDAKELSWGNPKACSGQVGAKAPPNQLLRWVGSHTRVPLV